ncbi:hypothetical protein ONS95_015052 [Cadophora gregata]|uniref:uncharacterized protein n=1 Tax=Cadophora gregata TaxID=51156 RepID=UPI0026DA771A|nr:uncharacterized protein ONS95_015052 [Cadophora gregata]KAK0124278.1 hypothetical protein ONS95_015052 [Cadophora gregata]
MIRDFGPACMHAYLYCMLACLAAARCQLVETREGEERANPIHLELEWFDFDSSPLISVCLQSFTDLPSPSNAAKAEQLPSKSRYAAVRSQKSRVTVIIRRVEHQPCHSLKPFIHAHALP